MAVILSLAKLKEMTGDGGRGYVVNKKKSVRSLFIALCSLLPLMLIACAKGKKAHKQPDFSTPKVRRRRKTRGSNRFFGGQFPVSAWGPYGDLMGD